MEKERTYFCIDLKSFYASVECADRGLDPLKTRLVVADPERSEKTICLAVTPALKALGVPGRCRIFQIPKEIDYIIAPPRMQRYIDCSADIYAIYLRYVSKEDIHVYSIDEVFMDVTDYLHLYQIPAEELAVKIMKDVLESTGITAACGIGTNLYLAKIALDIVAKKTISHIAFLDEKTYCRTLWKHKPLTDFWRVGKGTESRLNRMGIFTMGDIVKADSQLLYKIFGIDAELLIDHAWGRESTTIRDIKSYRPKETSVSSGQVLERDYSYEEGRIIVKEMAELLSLELVDKGLVTSSITLHAGYSNRIEMKSAHGTVTMPVTTSSSSQLISYTEQLYEQIVDKMIPVRRITLTFNRVMDELYQQYDLFTDPTQMEKEHRMQTAVLDIKERFGKNAVLKGMNLQKAATTRERNCQIGGHKSGD